MSRFNQRPENALKRANEFISVGKPNRALDTLYDVLKSKRNRTNATDKILEPIMVKYLELCVDLRKSHSAKEGLFQYRNMCQSTNVASLEFVVKRYLELADEKTAQARKESNQAVLDVDDLDNIQTPEGILMKAVSGEDAQDRSDRTILMPWVKFLWESYRQCLELLRTNVRVESLYHYVAKKAFSFCEDYKRKTEFRKLCDNLRLHLSHVLRQTGGPNAINLQQPETQQMNLETRLDQLDKAIKMELWTEAYKAIEDIHEFTVLSKKTPQPKMLANYYEKLSLVLWKAGNHLFHAAALLKLYQLSRNLKKNITPEELQELATRVLLATLAIPLPSAHPEFDRFFETEKSAMEKQHRLAQLLSLSQPPTRAGLVKDLVRYNVINHVHPNLRELYDSLEVEFSPLKLCRRVDSCLQYVATSEERLMKELREYTSAVQDITLTRLLKQLAQIYTNIEFPRLLELSVFTDPFRLERVIVNAVRHNDMQIRIDQRHNCIHFGADLSESQREELEEGPTLQPMPSEVIRTQLINVSTTLTDFLSTIQVEERKEENEEIRARIVKQYLDSMARDRQRILSRQRIIEERKELMERLANEREVEEQRRQEQVSRHHLLAEQRRLEQERLERERLRQEEELKAIQAKQIKDKIAQMSQTAHGQKVAQRLGAEIENLDPETLLQRQVEEIEKERREAANRLKSQEKKFDHLERAKRLEEIPLLQKELEARQVKDKELWEKEEKERVAHVIEERKVAVANKDRLLRMSADKNKFLEMIKSQRHAEFEEKLKEWKSKVDKEREVRMTQRREQIIKERREQRKREREEMLRKQKEEEERKRKEQEEEEKMERLRKEKEERDRINRELDMKAKIQRQREIEIEEREAKERERRAQEEKGSRGGFARGDRDRDREPERQRERSPAQEDNWRRAPRPAPTPAEPYRPPHAAETGGSYKPPHSRIDKYSKRPEDQRDREPRDDGGVWRRERPREETGGGWRDERRGEPDRRYDDRDRRDDRRMDDRDRREPDRRFEDRDRRDDRRYDDRREPERRDRDFRDRDADHPKVSQDSWRRPQQSDRDRPRDDGRPPMRRASPDRGGFGDRRSDDRRDQSRRDDRPQGDAYRPPGRRGSPERGAYRAPKREPSPPPRRVEEKPKEVEEDGWQTASSRKRR